jgi:hypothetical protein
MTAPAAAKNAVTTNCLCVCVGGHIKKKLWMRIVKRPEGERCYAELFVRIVCERL